jgi:hypothetical protein
MAGDHGQVVDTGVANIRLHAIYPLSNDAWHQSVGKGMEARKTFPSPRIE